MLICAYVFTCTPNRIFLYSVIARTDRFVFHLTDKLLVMRCRFNGVRWVDRHIKNKRKKKEENQTIT